MNSIRFRYAGLSIAVAASSWALACGSDGGASAPPGGGTGGFQAGTGGGQYGTGGVPGNGGTPPGNGGGSPVMPSDIHITGSVLQCPGTTPAALPNISATTCTLPSCQAATCVPKNVIQQFAPTTDLSLLGTCGSPDVLCLPNDYIATTGQFKTKSCVSLEGAEGRCISTCVPQVLTQLDRLPQADCAPSEKCAPCFNPIDGTDTKACRQGCDGGPTQPPYRFAECGGGAGVCVPQSLVPQDQLAALQAIDDPSGKCTDTTKLCAPKLKAADINANFAPCTMTSAAAAVATMANSTGQKSACVPKYIVPTGQQLLLLQDGCQANEMCAPCYNPLSNPPNQPTGACPP